LVVLRRWSRLFIYFLPFFSLFLGNRFSLFLSIDFATKGVNLYYLSISLQFFHFLSFAPRGPRNFPHTRIPSFSVSSEFLRCFHKCNTRVSPPETLLLPPLFAPFTGNCVFVYFIYFVRLFFKVNNCFEFVTFFTFPFFNQWT